jgi:uncharacterized membrane protein YagU involved in acid resistance
MSGPLDVAKPSPGTMLSGLLVGGLIGGALDLAFALGFAASGGTPPLRLLQIIASGLFGKPALDGGVPMAVWGLAAHFGLSLGWAGVYLLLVRVRPTLAARPWISGPLFGTLVFLAMRLVVLPLSAFPFPVSFKPLGTVLDLLSHMLFFGVPIALAVRRGVSVSKP